MGYLTGTSMVLRAFKRLGASVRGRSQEQPLAAPGVAGTLRARSGASLHESLLATELVASATYVVPFFFPASVLDARLPVYVFCLFLQESMLGNHPNVRRENTFSMKILILNHIQSVPRASSLGTSVHRMKFQILNLRTSVNYVG